MSFLKTAFTYKLDILVYYEMYTTLINIKKCIVCYMYRSHNILHCNYVSIEFDI